jgi:hypothetical protein
LFILLGYNPQAIITAAILRKGNHHSIKLVNLYQMMVQ